MDVFQEALRNAIREHSDQERVGRVEVIALEADVGKPTVGRPESTVVTINASQ